MCVLVRSRCEAHGGLDLCVYVGVLVAVWGEVVLGVCDVCFSVGRVSGSVCVCVCVCVCVRACRGKRSDRATQCCVPSRFPFSFPSVPELEGHPGLQANQPSRAMAGPLLISGTEKVRTVVFPLPTHKLLGIWHGRGHAWLP